MMFWVFKEIAIVIIFIFLPFGQSNFGSGMFTKSAHLNKLPRRRGILQLVWGWYLLHIITFFAFLALWVPFMHVLFEVSFWEIFVRDVALEYLSCPVNQFVLG
jgi:hypothetical protein